MSKCINNFIATPFLKWVKHIKEKINDTSQKRRRTTRKTIIPFENEGSPAAIIKEGDFVHLFYRAVRKGNHSSIGYVN
jgi:hypothetical protein